MAKKLLTQAEMLQQKRIEAELTAARNAEKSKNVIKSGNQPSQFGRVVLNEQRLIDNGHYMMTGMQATLAYLREAVKRAKKGKNVDFVHVKRQGGKTVSVIEKRKKLA